MVQRMKTEEFVRMPSPPDVKIVL
eukprot:SAG22_NODE_17039_length_312_cov_1.403756_1_plen_23_part_10